VSHNGGIRWHTRWVNVSQTLGGEWIGLTEIDDGEWDIYFGPLRLGRFHERTLTVEDALRPPVPAALLAPKGYLCLWTVLLPMSLTAHQGDLTSPLRMFASAAPPQSRPATAHSEQ
jgi:hypothetical protein